MFPIKQENKCINQINTKFPTMPRPHTKIIIRLQNYSAKKGNLRKL